MAVFLEGGLDLSYWSKYGLETFDEADDARVAAGQNWIEEQRMAYVKENRDMYLTGFLPVERPWRAEFLPQKLQFSKGKKLPSFVETFAGCVTRFAKSALVSEELKTLIETFKTSMDGWQFFPVEIFNRDGTKYGTYYVWWVHAVCDAIDKTSEAIDTFGGPADGRHKWNLAGRGITPTPERLRVQKSIFGERSAWIDFRFFARNGIFVSDALFEAMSEAGFDGFQGRYVWTEV